MSRVMSGMMRAGMAGQQINSAVRTFLYNLLIFYSFAGKNFEVCIVKFSMVYLPFALIYFKVHWLWALIKLRQLRLINKSPEI